MSQVHVVIKLSKRLISLQQKMRYAMECYRDYEGEGDEVKALSQREYLRRLRWQVAELLNCLHIAAEGAGDDCLENLYTYGQCLKPNE